ncbi:MAG TPA: DUF2147 domain-containing protein [Burkholderiaceae bacterium]
MKQAAAALVLAFASLAALAQSTPAGLWKTIDDDGKTEKSLVRITSDGGVFTGKVEKIFDPQKADAKCDKCSDDRKDKPIVGMTIINGVRQDADDASIFDGGEILDPAKGKTYRVRLKPIEGGRKLQVRGYLGPFFRTQEWIRAE